ncbi:helix-turn-helix domain-containing protein [Streptomyces silvensis]|uniref:DNA-binding protein n=1 Tax=Streptomyces silvensis TaxID=1765722 RepID=A0A0W7XAM1_9ACTN|nr:helix-turn-helix transcriptional regulator [Streptomyces silvensis]KUF19835.1 DNA-binding protein [Streptomyces silvensis]
MGDTYGDWLREQREAAGFTQQRLADEAIMSRTHIAHIEAGRRVPSAEDARRLDRALNTGDVLSRFRPGGDRRPVAAHFESALVLEQQATMIREFGLSYVPGILQTRRYADAALSVGFPPLAGQEREDAVTTRCERSGVLTDPMTPVVWALLDEAVLRRPVGGPEVMSEQIMHVVGLVDAGRVRAHVMPLGLGAHPLLMSMLSLMWFEDQPPVAYVEGLRTGKVHDEPAMVQHMQSAYDLALGDALPLRESLALMKAIAKGYGDHV